MPGKARLMSCLEADPLTLNEKKTDDLEFMQQARSLQNVAIRPIEGDIMAPSADSLLGGK